MYVRRCYRTKNGKRHGYWALVESYRTTRGPRQRVVAYLGDIDDQGRMAWPPSARAYQQSLYETREPRWVEVDLTRIRVERTRDFGGPWLGTILLERLDLPPVSGARVTAESRRDPVAGDGAGPGPRPPVRAQQ